MSILLLDIVIYLRSDSFLKWKRQLVRQERRRISEEGAYFISFGVARKCKRRNE